mmetsp:Transcript_20078/g.48734  ORF Transcript_20078/g.48734 Transcript_20078/m.48734 type:complete len:92 (-) Transcript_20078:119-394(-)
MHYVYIMFHITNAYSLLEYNTYTAGLNKYRGLRSIRKEHLKQHMMSPPIIPVAPSPCLGQISMRPVHFSSSAPLQRRHQPSTFPMMPIGPN